MSIRPEDLPPEIRAILGEPAREGASFEEQPVCHADYRVTSQLSDEPAGEVVKPWRIVNARKGDLLLSPGGPSGMIGGLLKQLDRPQLFSHIGIMTEDEVEVRHTTACGDRAMHSSFTTGEILGQPAPTNGYREEAVKYQWPGSITQRIEQAYLTWRDHPVQQDRSYESGRSVPDPDFSVLDSVTNERWHIDAFSFAPEMMRVGSVWREVWPVIVKPCPDLETTGVRRALHRIADTSKEIRGHYRLFSYSRAAIAGNSRMAGPPMLEETRRDPHSRCSGAEPNLVPVRRTVPLVCSTFVWWAVQEANRVGSPRIVLDLRPLHRRRTDICLNSPLLAVPPSPHDDRVEPRRDGLYRYTADERKRAGTWLHDEYIIPAVRSAARDAIPFLGRVLYPILLNLFLLLPTAAIASLLGIDVSTLDGAILWLTDMANHVANQVCNTFASDWSDRSSIDSEAWKEPGSGLTVSPDDILNEWAPPQKETGRLIVGLYGYNERMILRPPEGVPTPPPKSTWQISQGFARKFVGRVFLRDAGGARVGVRGAHVRVGSKTWVTGDRGWYTATRDDRVPTGRYWGIASYTHQPTGLHLESRGHPVEVDFDGPDDADFELLFPPESRREVHIQGRMTLINRHIIGHDWWGYPEFITRQAFLDINCFLLPDTPEYAAQRETYLGQTLEVSLPVEDWGSSQIQFELSIQRDNSVKVTCRARLYQSEDDRDWQATGTLTVPPKARNTDPGVSGPSVDIMRVPISPVRAYIDFTVHNNRAS